VKVYLFVKTRKKELGGCFVEVKHQGLFWGVAKSFGGVSNKEIGLLVKEVSIETWLKVR
jgi:hypothetical protein